MDIQYNSDKKTHPIWSKLTKDHLGHYRSKWENIELIILCGNATESINDLPQYLENKTFHAIFQDAFSPRKNPQLWTQQWFRTLHSFSHQECIMSTYCSSKGPREAMISAGWEIKARPGFGRKKHSTVATIKSV